MFCKELNKEFNSERELFDALKSNKDEIISLKRSKTDRTINTSLGFVKKSSEKSKKQLSIGDKVRVAMNTVNYLDYDLDLLVDGAWTKSAKEQNGKTYHVVGHNLELGQIVAYPKDVKIYVEKISWQELGVDADGETEVLVFVSKLTEKTNKDAFLAYRDGEDIEHSIRLQYIKMDLALNSEEEEDKLENEIWEKYYQQIVNKEFADKHKYFWVVSEAKILKEGSIVLFGANEATPQLKMKPSNDTSKEPSNDTQIDYNYLIKKFKTL